MKASPTYAPNQRHCMYGQDADLIMLGLVSHEPHFTLLREVVDFGGFQRNKNASKTVIKHTKESKFQLLHLSVLREYLDLEFRDEVRERGGCVVASSLGQRRVVNARASVRRHPTPEHKGQQSDFGTHIHTVPYVSLLDLF